MFNLPSVTKPAWAGPLVGGLTQSIINRYLDCPFRFYLWAVLGRDDPTPPNPNLVWGSTCHYGLETIIRDPQLVRDFSPEKKEELRLKINQYVADKYPSAGASFPESCYQMVLLYDDSYKAGEPFETEIEFEDYYTTARGNRVKLRGKVDGLSDRSLVEHKCVGFNDPNQARLETPEDLQIRLYALMKDRRHVIYDKIKIPDTNKWVPQRRGQERISHWVHRIYHTHFYKEYPIAKNRYLWLDQFDFYIDDDNLEQWRKFQLNPLIDMFCRYWDKVTDSSFDPNNPDCYDELFWVKPIRTFDASRTEKYKCNYYDYLTGHMTYDQLHPTTFYAELNHE